ncbi:MAG: DUF4954 family protein [Bacteroidaceae bacterium]|nr:DUF4954 family protein [Bacteroidaceae bacterium]MBR1683449.1 DUF4954 family protein [Bacteroidaceae bacterium]
MRPLTQTEIALLESQACSAEDWARVQITDDASLKYIRHTRFSGDIRIGAFTKSFDMPGGIHKHSGLFHATLHNVTIGDDCCIENIKNYIANYDIAHDTFIENVDIILCDSPTSFGNGVEVAVLNETGGREVTIHDHLTAHEAYLETFYRHRPLLIEHLKGYAARRTAERTSTRGTIGEHVTIVDTGYIKNMYVGAYAKVEGAGRLKNGTLNSRQEAPVHVGYGVIADDFIIQDGSAVEDSTTLTRVYVGQACTLGHGYSASDSLFFCNCQEENGEACAIFAGPFTVTHHKSTLLIAGLFSFMNAGSGSNQSNHMYKLGPIHQGAMERGAKTSSDSYILWPARIGAFSLVMGRHSSHADTSDLPFSYLIEKNGETYLAPAVNLRSVGTVRDAQKWPKRDRRHPEGRMDQINFNLLSPYTIDKMLRGLHILEELERLSGPTSDVYAYQSAKISNSSLHRGQQLYRIAIEKFLGNSLISHLERTDCSTAESVLEGLKPTRTEGRGLWVDLAGLIAPKELVNALLDDVEADRVPTGDAFNSALLQMHENYYKYEWTWAYEKMLEYYGLYPDRITIEDLITIIRRWKQSVVRLDEMLYADAKKEFSLSARTGFGFDGASQRTVEADFEQVRGDFETNPFVMETQAHIQRKSALGDRMIAMLEAL